MTLAIRVWLYIKSVVKGNRTRVYTIRYYVLESAVNATLLNMGSDCVGFLSTRCLVALLYLRSSIFFSLLHLILIMSYLRKSMTSHWWHEFQTNEKIPEDDKCQAQKKDSMDHELSNSVMIVMVCFWNLQSDRDRHDIPKFHFVKFHLMDNGTSSFFS